MEIYSWSSRIFKTRLAPRRTAQKERGGAARQRNTPSIDKLINLNIKLFTVMVLYGNHRCRDASTATSRKQWSDIFFIGDR